jgi:deoxyhypusine synthase
VKKIERTNLARKRLAPLDINKCADIEQILDAMADTAFGGRTLGEAWRVLKAVMDDPECRLIVTVSGAMSVAKLGRVLGQLITEGIAHAIVSTGAVIVHSLVEELGMYHTVYDNALGDRDLLELGLNRIYDSIEPEENLERLERSVLSALATLDAKRAYASTELITCIANTAAIPQSVGLVGSAVGRGVPIFVPALSDSEIGLYLFKFQATTERTYPIYDPSRDLALYAEWLKAARRVAILTIGGGTPRNWSQQMVAFLRCEALADGKDAGIDPFVAGIRICPDPEYLGHLSGSPFSECVSWGKVQPDAADKFAEVHCDATIVLPFLAKAAVEYKRRIQQARTSE